MNITLTRNSTKPLFSTGKSKKAKANGQELKKAEKENKHRLPIVNLLPPELAMAENLRATRRAFWGIGLATLMAIVVVWFGQTATISAYSDLLTQAQTSMQKQMTAVQSKENVSTYFQALAARERLLATMTPGVEASEVMSALTAALPGGGTISALAITSPGADQAQASCSGGDNPFGTDDTHPSACVTATFRVGSTSEMTSVVNSLQQSGEFSSVSVSQSTNNQDGAVEFSVLAAVKAEGGSTK